ncbi:hypothetical protein [Clostridium sp. DL1XJH146]
MAYFLRVSVCFACPPAIFGNKLTIVIIPSGTNVTSSLLLELVMLVLEAFNQRIFLELI